MREENIDAITAAIGKKAVGYETSETVDEYALVDGSLTLVKRRVCVKEVPPDVAAARLLMEMRGDVTAEMTEAELAAEKLRLLKLLKETDNDDNDGKTGGKVHGGRVQKPRGDRNIHGKTGDKIAAEAV